MKKRTSENRFSSDEIRSELKRVTRKYNGARIFMQTLFSLFIVAAVSVLISVLFIPVFRVTGSSMQPTLERGQLVVCIKTSSLSRGDIAAFYYNNKVLLKRVIAVCGDTVDIDSEGNVFVNDSKISEPYIKEKNKGQCDAEFPLKVPENRIFVMGDNRASSADSRISSIGCVPDEFVIGRVFIRIWPFGDINIL